MSVVALVDVWKQDLVGCLVQDARNAEHEDRPTVGEHALHELTVEGGLEACQLLPEAERYGACARQVYVEGVACAHGGVVDLAHGVGV